MKTLTKAAIAIFFLSFFISPRAYAITGRDNWQTIRESGEVLIQQPTFAGAFGSNGLFNVCFTEDEFRGKQLVRTCLSYQEVIDGSSKKYVCTDYELRNVSISRTYIQNVCLRHAPMNDEGQARCLEHGPVTSVYPTSFQFAVFDIAGPEYGNYLFSKTYSIPRCE